MCRLNKRIELQCWYGIPFVAHVYGCSFCTTDPKTMENRSNITITIKWNILVARSSQHACNQSDAEIVGTTDPCITMMKQTVWITIRSTNWFGNCSCNQAAIKTISCNIICKNYMWALRISLLWYGNCNAFVIVVSVLTCHWVGQNHQINQWMVIFAKPIRWIVIRSMSKFSRFYRPCF